MTVPLGVRTGSMIAGTIFAAAGLNLAVLGLGTSDDGSDTEAVASSATGQAGVVATGGPESVVPTSDDVAPLPPPLPAPAERPPTDDVPPGGNAPGADGQPEATAAPATAGAATTSIRAPTVGPSGAASATTAGRPAVYQIRGIGEVVVARHGGDAIALISVITEADWVHRVGEDGPREIRVDFHRNGSGDDDGEATFKVKLEDGELRVEQESDIDD